MPKHSINCISTGCFPSFIIMHRRGGKTRKKKCISILNKMHHSTTWQKSHFKNFYYILPYAFKGGKRNYFIVFVSVDRFSNSKNEAS